MILYSQISWSGNMFYICGTDICFIRKSECLNFACRIFENVFEPFIIHIADSDLALFKQQALAILILVKVFVFVRSDVIFAKVRKNSDLKRNAGCTVKLQSL